MKCGFGGLPTLEVGIKFVEGLDTSPQVRRAVQRAILLQLLKEAHQRILDRHFLL